MKAPRVITIPPTRTAPPEVLDDSIPQIQREFLEGNIGEGEARQRLNLIGDDIPTAKGLIARLCQKLFGG